MKENTIATNSEPHECVIFANSTKIRTYENKTIHSIHGITMIQSKLRVLIGNIVQVTSYLIPYSYFDYCVLLFAKTYKWRTNMEEAYQIVRRYVESEVVRKKTCHDHHILEKIEECKEEQKSYGKTSKA